MKTKQCAQPTYHKRYYFLSEAEAKVFCQNFGIPKNRLYRPILREAWRKGKPFAAWAVDTMVSPS